jgi:hypothetical protein
VVLMSLMVHGAIDGFVDAKADRSPMPNEFQLRVESLHSLAVIDITFLAIALSIWCREASKNETSRTTWKVGHQNQ